MSSSDTPAPAIDPSRFYKSSSLHQRFSNQELSSVNRDVETPRWMRSLTDSPTSLWKVFNKQNDALQFSKDHGEGLMTFAFQDSEGSRHFLSAHPVPFWWYDSAIKRPEERRTYEVIAENSVCKLYFDLEFEKEFNKGHNGVQMTNTFIKIISHFLQQEFGVSYDRSFVLDLDSTTDTKFSRHLVYPRTYFRDNYNVGSFVKMICSKLRLLILSPSALQEFCVGCEVKDDDVKSLFVMDKHKVRKIFCDEAVYTKNRHFRVYKSTKWNKNSPLIISQENEFQSLSVIEEKAPETQLFLDSLITYIGDVRSVDGDSIFAYGGLSQANSSTSTLSLASCENLLKETAKSSVPSSPHPAIDRFIEKVVNPGRIRRSAYFSSLKKVTYEISGNRFCHNVGRHHKSNNVFYVVDLNSFVFYQKCFDPDCSGYRSAEKSLPDEVCFLLSNEGDEVFNAVSQLCDGDLLGCGRAAPTAAAEGSTCPMECSGGFPRDFPDFGLSDAELLKSSNVIDNNDVA